VQFAPEQSLEPINGRITMDWSRRALLTFFTMLAGAGCATHGVSHVTLDESRPHISWEIRSGPDHGDENSVCSAAQAGKICVLAASTDQRRSLAAVHLFVHAAAQPTSYVGFMRAPFLEGEGGRKLGEINATVRPGSRPAGTLVVARVSAKPGSYTLSLSVDATQAGEPNPVHIAEKIAVIVK
jgi:hypothetical protein